MMMITVMEGGNIHTRDELHDALIRALNLPTWYGRNLDALYDCLTESKMDTELRLLHPGRLEEALGGYARTLISVLRDAAAENPHFRVTLESRSDKV
ncbi:MAG: barstar family protein [Oscillibacter sp.]|nr:barstar family protein [Oscillibacter sp.]